MKEPKYQARVYEACKLIPSGRFSTYKYVAEYLNSSPRAVGQALKCNPYAPIVPCHRVIASNFTLGGFYGKMNSSKKIEMLKEEGLEFVEGRLALEHRDKLFDFKDIKQSS